MELKVVKIIDYSKKYTDKNGKERPSVDYYLVINDTYVAIRPSFSKGYLMLDVVATVIKNGKQE